jgi:hypothetical protein
MSFHVRGKAARGCRLNGTTRGCDLTLFDRVPIFSRKTKSAPICQLAHCKHPFQHGPRNKPTRPNQTFVTIHKAEWGEVTKFVLYKD